MRKINENKVKELIEELKTLNTFDESKKRPSTKSWSNWKSEIVNSNKISTDLIKEFLDEYNRVIENSQKIENVDTDDRAVTNIERDENGLIQYYTFEIFRKDSPTLQGKLDRKEMETLYRLYSYYGANLTQKIVSREFPYYTFVEFKRILRAFNIYKANSEFAPHQVEELSEEQLINLHNQNKENNVLRRIEKDQLTEANKLINKLLQENKKYSDSSLLYNELLKYKPSYTNIAPLHNSKQINKDTLVIWLSDLHVGAYNEKYGFFELPDYDKQEILRRLDIIIESFAQKEFNEVIVVDLGDSTDQFNKETTRGGHLLPNNMTDKEMAHLYLDCMTQFFYKLTKNVYCDKFSYYAIGESNHSGNFGWALNHILALKIQEEGWNTYISDYPIDYFTIGEDIFIYLHGKDIGNQSKAFPLTLNPQTELYFANYLAQKHIYTDGKVYIVKGDLHNYAYSSGKQFDYVSVGSLYATSNYIAANFGNTPWSINYTIINGNQTMFGKISD